MSARRLTTLAAVVEQIAELRRGGIEDEPIAYSILADSSRDVVLQLARHDVVEEVRRQRRVETLRAERDAQATQRETPEQAEPAGHPGDGWARSKRKKMRERGAPDYEEWTKQSEEGRQYEDLRQRYDEADEKNRAQLWAEVGAITEQYASRLKIQWTEELLGSEFALPSGALVTWGEATVANHEARRDMFMANAQGNVEGAARHTAAIGALREAGASTLNELSAARSSTQTPDLS